MGTTSIVQVLILFIAGASALYEDCTHGVVEDIRNGKCDDRNNNEGCEYDGGDCCECTVTTTLEYYYDDTTSFFCLDPNSGCVNPLVGIYPNCTDGDYEIIGDGECNLENNNDECGYDGGDCCACTRSSSGSSSFFETSSSFSYCVDPTVSCYDSSLVPIESTCTNGNVEDIRNGKCNEENNSEYCLFDGGDCCSCTCVDGDNYDCGNDGFNCVDPDVAHLEDYICVERPTNHTFCTADLQRDWIVENVTQAQALADVVQCAGGAFNVIWKGNITLNETISIFDGTVLNITSIDEDSTIGGDGKICLFTVVNASLHLKNIKVSNGSSTFGGAIAASRSTLTFNRVVFSDSAASSGGGAVFVSNGSVVSFVEDTYFVNNIAFRGGALYAMGESNVSWTGNSTFSDNVSTSGGGGAVYVRYSSNAVWNAATRFLNNSAYIAGGAVCVIESSSAVWTAASYFVANSAEAGWGGALSMDNSSVRWTAASQFLNNSAKDIGGALYLGRSSSAIWSAESSFVSNTADNYGGALYVSESSVAWGGEATFEKNAVDSNSGGAICVLDSSRAVWTAASTFLANSAQSDGGACYSGNNGALIWRGNVTFVNNSADNGGALFVTNGVETEFSGETSFSSNKALSNGGAVGSIALDSELSMLSSGTFTVVNDNGSAVTFKGPTTFVNNTCGSNGGGMALVQSLAVSFENKNITFLRNSAEVSGGAVFVSGTGIGTVFSNVTFVENSAQSGGGVYATGSGTTVTIDGHEETNNPTTFDGCSFVGNIAFATGGAVDSASGQDVFVRTSFEGNIARVGGALRLAGTASIDNCSFDENMSELDEGPAVSNVGFISNVTNSNFRDNVFDCESQTFLDFNKSDGLFETVCDGCPEKCFDCYFEGAQIKPTCTSLSDAGIEYATSEGGTTTLEELEIFPGYWRATSTSLNVKECFNSEACLGGLTGASDYCLEGYEGPYCSVCKNNYVSSLSFTCRECSNRTIRITVAVVFAVLALAVVLMIIWYLVAGERGDPGRGIVGRVTKRIPMQSVKIIIVMWQILTQFASVANVTFPNVYQKFLDGIEFVSFDLSWVVSAGCFFEVDFHDRLLWTTIAPVVIMALLGVSYAVAACRNGRSAKVSLRNIQNKHMSIVLLVTFLVYSSVSSVVFQTFACDNLDDDTRYLRADYSIDCDAPKHRSLQIYAGIMIIVYPIGIPALYAGLLFSIRHKLRNEKGEEESLIVRSTTDLWKPYKPQTFYYEVIECGRRIMLAGVVVFIYPNTSAQIADTLAIAVVFMLLSEVMAPYESQWDAWISRTGHAIVVASIYLALLLMVDVSNEDDASQKMFEVTLVVAHGCLILAVLVEATVMALSLRAETQQGDDSKPTWKRRDVSTNGLKKVEDPRSMLRRSSNFNWKVDGPIADEEDCYKYEF